MIRAVDKEVKQRVIHDLLLGMKRGEIYEKYGIKRGTLLAWRKSDVEFQNMYRDALEEIQEEAMYNFKGLFSLSVDKLREIIMGDDLKLSLEAIKLVMSPHMTPLTKEEVVQKTEEIKEDTFTKVFGIS